METESKADKLFAKRYARVLAGIAGVIASVTAIDTFLIKVFDFPSQQTSMIVGTIAVAIFAIGCFIDKMITSVNKSLDARLVSIRDEIRENEEEARERARKHELAMCRLELSDLMNNDRDNIVAIKRKAAHYFCDLDGNDGMGERFSRWAKENGVDIGDVMRCEIHSDM